MSDSFGKARIEIGADTSQAEKDLSKAAKDQMPKKGEEMAKGLNSGFEQALNFKNLLIGAVTGATVMYFRNLANEIDRFAKDAQRLGIASDTLSEMAYAAQLSGVGLGELNAGVRILARNMNEANTGASTMQDAFKRIGIEYKNTDGSLRDVNDVIGDLAGKFEAMPDGALKTATAMELLGRSGSQLIPYLNSGREGVKGMREEANLFGVTVTRAFGKNVEHFNDNITRFQTIIKGAAYTIMDSMVPAINTLADKFIDWYKTAAPDILEGMRAGFLSIANSIIAVSQALGGATGDSLSFGKIIQTVLTSFSVGFNSIVVTIAKFFNWYNHLAKSSGMFRTMFGYTSEQQVDQTIAATNALIQRMNLSSWQGLMNLENMKNKHQALDFFGSNTGLVKPGAGAGGRAGGRAGGAAGTATVAIDGLVTAIVNLGTAARIKADEIKNTSGLGPPMYQPYLQNVGTGGRDFSGVNDIYGLAPAFGGQEAQDFFAGGGDIGEAFNFYMTGLSSLVPTDGFITYLTEQWAKTNEAFAEQSQVLVDNFRMFGMTFEELAGTFGGLVSGFFSDAVTGGLKSAGLKFVAALAGIVGKIVMQHGIELIAAGTKAVIIGSNPVFPMPHLVAWGKMSIIKGVAMTALGGAISGASSLLGGTASGGAGGSGTSFQSGIARPYGATNQPVVYDVGQTTDGQAAGTTINLNVSTVDAASFGDFLKRGGGRVIEDHIAGAVRGNNPIRRTLRDGLSY